MSTGTRPESIYILPDDFGRRGDSGVADDCAGVDGGGRLKPRQPGPKSAFADCSSPSSRSPEPAFTRVFARAGGRLRQPGRKRSFSSEKGAAPAKPSNEPAARPVAARMKPPHAARASAEP